MIFLIIGLLILVGVIGYSIKYQVPNTFYPKNRPVTLIAVDGQTVTFSCPDVHGQYSVTLPDDIQVAVTDTVNISYTLIKERLETLKEVFVNGELVLVLDDYKDYDFKLQGFLTNNSNWS